LSDLLKEFAVVFLAVGVLQLVWDFLGGDLLELRIEEVRDQVASLERIMNLPSDLIEHKIGIQRIWPDRETWQENHSEGLKVWRDRVCEAKRVSIMSNTLWNNWMKNDEFREKLFERIKDGASVRILIYGPGSDAASLRARIEDDMEGQMQNEIKSTLYKVAQGWDDLPASAKKNLKVRLTTWALHSVQIVQADKLMLLSLYLSGKSGTPSPTMLLGSGTSYFGKYAEQFEIIWEWGTPLDDEQFRRILQGDWEFSVSSEE
jgi:hypothetical protein